MKRDSLAAAYLVIFSLAALLFALWFFVPQDPYAMKLASYLPFHMFAETFSIVVAIMIFGITWNAFSPERPGGMIALSCAMLAAGLIDFGHMLSVTDMPAFVTPSGPEKGIAFWLSARLVVAVGFAAAALHGEAPLRPAGLRYLVLGTALGITVLTYWVTLFHLDWLPRTFVPGTGLTAAKMAVEYLIIGVLIVPAIVFCRRARRTRTALDIGLFAAVSVAILSEMHFVIYAAAHDLFQVFGHAYKIVAFLILWRAVFVISVREPFEKLKELSRRAVAIQEEERRRLATVVHDVISPNLAATKIQCDMIRAELSLQAQEKLHPRFEDVRALIDDTDACMRDLCSELRHPMLDYSGLLPAVASYVDRFSARTGIPVSLTASDSSTRLPGDVESTLFRIVQEALTNCAKHAKPENVRIDLRHDAKRATLTIEDNGKGFAPEDLASSRSTPGHGLLSMRERTELAGGRFSLESVLGHGTRIIVAV